MVRRILNLAAAEWVDEHGLTWLLAPPKIKLLARPGKRAALSAQLGGAERLFGELPEYLAEWRCLP